MSPDNIPYDRRWSRQVLIPQFGDEAQRKLAESKVAVLGVGGVGCPAALYLAAAGVGSMLLVDGDVVEASNLNRQILFHASDIGQSKAEIGSARLRGLNPDLDVEAVSRDVREHDLKDMLRGCHFVLDCFDRNASRLMVNRACLRMGLPAVHGFCQDFSGEIFTVIPGKSACLACALDESFPEPEVFPIIGVTAGTVGLAMAAAAIKDLTGVGDLMAGQRLIYDLAYPEVLKLPVERNSRCPDCSQ
ncbi:MAG TPA: HesA/MoeB/ThiF family protein [Methanotrichaceae archaeon]|nr:HesA/MoeB/ThiF family protein [Methanotrichaceae archaeon]